MRLFGAHVAYADVMPPGARHTPLQVRYIPATDQTQSIVNTDFREVRVSGFGGVLSKA